MRHLLTDALVMHGVHPPTHITPFSLKSRSDSR